MGLRTPSNDPDPAVGQAQRALCTRFGVRCDPPDPASKVGIALQTRRLQPLNASRHPPEAGTCGWYLWWGDPLTEDPEFFQPLHVEHLPERCPEFLPYLALPSGWRVQLSPGHEDVWFDEALLGG
jgi:hypothetical protein